MNANKTRQATHNDIFFCSWVTKNAISKPSDKLTNHLEQRNVPISWRSGEPNYVKPCGHPGALPGC